jgi:hypothetical protein
MAGAQEEDEVSGAAAAAAAAAQDGVRESEALKAAVGDIVGVVVGIASEMPVDQTEVLRLSHNSELAGAGIEALVMAVAKDGWLAGVVYSGGGERHSDAVRRCSWGVAVESAGVAVVVLAVR